MFKINIYKEEILENQYIISPNKKYIIGRKGKGADIELEHPFISAQHLSVELSENSEIFISDIGSTHGSFLNSFQNPLPKSERRTLIQQDLVYLALNSGLSLQIVFENENNLEAKITDFFQHHPKISIGRAADNLIVLAHPTVSRYHAYLYKEGNLFFVKEIAARNGTFVNGQLITESQSINATDWIQVGPYQFCLETPQTEIISHKNSQTAAIIAKDLVTTLPNGSNILDLRGINIPIPEGEMIAIMGPSGCGKSTFINALSGNFPANPENGSIKIWGFELNQTNFSYLKQFIGFVPQENIVHENLRVRECLFYAAKLKLPDATEEERNQRIWEVLTQLQLNENQSLGLQEKMIAALSGGQKKRICIAIELLSKPSVLFLDEPTSPLDPQTIDEFLLCLRNLTQGKPGEKGTTIIMVTHKPEDLAYMDKLMFLATGGFLTYYGDIQGVKPYFEVENVKDIYAKTDTIEKGKVQTLRWQQSEKIKNISKYHSQNEKEQAIPKADSPFRQFYWLSKRYFTLKTNDFGNTFLMLLQAPIIAVLMCFMFEKISLSLVFMMAISAVWFGTNNAGREIIGEMPIYVRERMFNLRIIPHILSKISVLMAFSVLQIVGFLAILSLKFSLPNLKILFLLLLTLSLAAILLGLLISAAVKNNEQVMTTIPMILIPQILLAGVLSEVKGGLEILSRFTLLRWTTAGLADAIGEIPSTEICTNAAHKVQKCADSLPNLTKLPAHQLQSEMQISTFEWTWLENMQVLCLFIIAFFIATTFILKRKDPFRKLK
jgi:ABC transport system ATP-binding/permease protein